MSTTARLRYELTKQPFIDAVLTWFQHSNVVDSDVMVASYPRSGSTWLRFILCELLTGVETSFDLVDEVLADVGHHGKAPSLLPNSGRLLKTHEPYCSKYHRAIYLVRDVRDVVLSEYIFLRREQYFTGEFSQFFDLFLQGRTNRYGFWADHVQSWLHYADENPHHVLLIRFEDQKNDPAGIVRQCLDFLGVARADVDIRKAVDNHNLAHMREKEDQADKFKGNAEGLRFITDGAVGKGKQQLTDEQRNRLVNAAYEPLLKLGYLKPIE